jgi:hypothetical protein
MFAAAKLAIPGMFLVVVSLCPFVNKAYTIDDPLFLLSAHQIRNHPLLPMSYPICWVSSELCVDSAATLGPLGAQAMMGYVLVPVILAGGSEWIAHVVQILLSCIAVLAMVRLALRLGFDRVQATIAGLMLAAVPPFLSMASTAMPDILAIALGLTGLDRLLAWRDEHRSPDAVLAALTLGLAPFARPHLALFLPFSALWLFDDFRFSQMVQKLRQQAYLWIPVLAAGGIFIAVSQLTSAPEAAASETMIGLQKASNNLSSYFLYLAFPIPFAAVWLGVHWRKAPAMLLLPAVPVVLYHFIVHDTSLQHEWSRAAILYGFVALGHMLYSYWHGGSWTDRLLGLWVLFPLAAVFYIHLPLKYMISAMPAIVLIMVRTLWQVSTTRAVAASAVLIVVCTAFSWLLLRADDDFADYGRRAAAELIVPHVAAGEKVWYAGQWGFYWYARVAGSEVFVPGQSPAHAGDLLAVGDMEGGNAILKYFPNRELIDSRHYPSPYGRTMGHGGALYSNLYGRAPWVWEPGATNDYELWRIR